METFDKVQSKKADLIQLRREFHMYPELGLQEYETANRIIRELESIGIPYKRFGKTGIVGVIEGAKAGKTLMLRADMDALAITEENQCEYRSKHTGVMHACGHDGHMASLLISAQVLHEHKQIIAGRILLVFQPSEENVEGAALMIKDGVLENVDAAFGLHIWNDLEIGTISAESGPRMAASEVFRINVYGHGGHGGLPHQCVDTLLICANIVNQLQSIVSRNISSNESVVITVGQLHCGTKENIIANEGFMEGTIRYFNPSLIESIKEQINTLAIHTAEAYGGKIECVFKKEVPPLINHDELSTFAQTIIEKQYGKSAHVHLEKMSSNEDFAFYAEKIPSLFVFVGSKNIHKKEYFPHHHPKFDIDEDALVYATDVYIQFALQYLSR